VLALWVSTGHSIFTLPNTNHRQLLLLGGPIASSSSSSRSTWAQLLGHNWVAAAVLLWYSAGLVVTFVGLGLGVIAASTGATCAFSLVWSAGIHSLWAYMSKRVTCLLLAEQVDIIGCRRGDQKPMPR
jgi:hypothetical protein